MWLVRKVFRLVLRKLSRASSWIRLSTQLQLMFHGKHCGRSRNSLMWFDESSYSVYVHQGGPLALQSTTQLNHGGLSFYNLWFVLEQRFAPICTHLFDVQVPR